MLSLLAGQSYVMQDPAFSFLRFWPECDGRSPEHAHRPPLICKKHEVINTAGNAGTLSPAEEEQAREQSEGASELVPLGEAGAFRDSGNDVVSRTLKAGSQKAVMFNHVYCKHQKGLQLAIRKNPLKNNESTYCLHVHDSLCMRSKASCFHERNVITNHSWQLLCPLDEWSACP